MKSSKRGVSPMYFIGLATSLVFLFTVSSQSGYKVRVVDEENVLGTSTPHTTTVTRTMNSVGYICKRTDCDKVANGGGLFGDDDDADSNNGNNCRAVKDSSNKSVCYWSNPTWTAAQCNVETSVYRNRGTDKGAQNLYFSENGENVVYYNCVKIVPTPKPTSKPMPTPTPACQQSYTRITGKCKKNGTQLGACSNGVNKWGNCNTGLICKKTGSSYLCMLKPTPATKAPSNVR